MLTAGVGTDGREPGNSYGIFCGQEDGRLFQNPGSLSFALNKCLVAVWESRKVHLSRESVARSWSVTVPQQSARAHLGHHTFARFMKRSFILLYFQSV